MAPPPPIPTLGDLEREGRSVTILCNRCRRQRVSDALNLRLRLGAEQPLDGLWRRLRCVECGASGRTQGDVFSMPGPRRYSMGLTGEGRGI